MNLALISYTDKSFEYNYFFKSYNKDLSFEKIHVLV